MFKFNVKYVPLTCQSSTYFKVRLPLWERRLARRIILIRYPRATISPDIMEFYRSGKMDFQTNKAFADAIVAVSFAMNRCLNPNIIS